MNIQELQFKLYEKLKPSGWGDKLKAFLLSGEFKNILTTLYDNVQTGKRFTPVLKEMFRAFEECPYSQLKVVIIGQDPYPQINVADGIAFSCSHTEKPQPSLRYIFGDIVRTVYPEGHDLDPDLKRWSNQGILMLNTALTCEVGKIGSHVELWKPFISYLLDILNSVNTGIIYVFMGEKAKVWHTMISSKRNYKMFTTHPVSAAYRGDKTWDSGNVFNNINKIIFNNNGDTIIW